MLSILTQFLSNRSQHIILDGSAEWCSVADTHIILLTVKSVVPVFELGVCLRVTLLIVDLWQYCVCCKRSGVTRRTLPGLYVPVRITCGALVAPQVIQNHAVPQDSLQNHAIQQDFYSTLSVPLERSC